MPMTKYTCGLAFLLACGSAETPNKVPANAAAATTIEAVALPGASGPVTVDFIAYDARGDRVWIPVGETGSVDVFDPTSRTFTRVDGFKTEEREVRGRKRTMGPSSVAFGDGVAFVGDRASNEVCPVDQKTMKLGACVKLDSAPDAVAYVAMANEVWVTTPKEPSITVLEAPTLRVETKIQTAGEPEAYAIHGDTFLTNYEDKNVTVAIDVTSRTVKATWPLQCSDGPRGLVSAAPFVIVACTNGLELLDPKHEGHVLGKLDVGEGVDIIDVARGTLYVAAGKTSRLTLARADDKGALSAVETITTRPGVRNAVVDARGRVYAVDAAKGELLVITPATR
jgi:hypothetical protein